VVGQVWGELNRFLNDAMASAGVGGGGALGGALGGGGGGQKGNNLGAKGAKGTTTSAGAAINAVLAAGGLLLCIPPNDEDEEGGGGGGGGGGSGGHGGAGRLGGRRDQRYWEVWDVLWKCTGLEKGLGDTMNRPQDHTLLGVRGAASLALAHGCQALVATSLPHVWQVARGLLVRLRHLSRFSASLSLHSTASTEGVEGGVGGIEGHAWLQLGRSLYLNGLWVVGP
jgi:hypothetical protein